MTKKPRRPAGADSKDRQAPGAPPSTRGLDSNPGWNATRVRTLRRDLALSQEALARRLGVRQQTVSEWETGAYAPRGASAMMLGVLAERAERPYRADAQAEQNKHTEQSNG